MLSPGGAGRSNYSFRGHIPHGPDAVQVGIGRQHEVSGSVCVNVEVRFPDPLLSDYPDFGIVLRDGLLEGIVALTGDKKVGGMVNESDLTLALQSLCHEMSGGNTVAVVVCRHSADIIFSRFEPRGNI